MSGNPEKIKIDYKLGSLCSHNQILYFQTTVNGSKQIAFYMQCNFM